MQSLAVTVRLSVFPIALSDTTYHHAYRTFWCVTSSVALHVQLQAATSFCSIMKSSAQGTPANVRHRHTLCTV